MGSERGSGDLAACSGGHLGAQADIAHVVSGSFFRHAGGFCDVAAGWSVVVSQRGVRAPRQHQTERCGAGGKCWAPSPQIRDPQVPLTPNLQTALSLANPPPATGGGLDSLSTLAAPNGDEFSPWPVSISTIQLPFRNLPLRTASPRERLPAQRRPRAPPRQRLRGRRWLRIGRPARPLLETEPAGCPFQSAACQLRATLSAGREGGGSAGRVAGAQGSRFSAQAQRRAHSRRAGWRCLAR